MRGRSLAVLGSGKLTRVGLFFENAGPAWDFRSYDILDDQVIPIVIPGLDPKQTSEFLESDSNGTFLTRTVKLPVSKAGSDQLFDILDSERDFFERINYSKINIISTSISRIENPTRHLPGTIDCVSCHATPAVQSVLRKYSLSPLNPEESFLSKNFGRLGETKNSFYTTSQFRLFGYFEKQPMIGQRVVNETANIIDLLSEQR